jgi:hypothetical protein
MAGFAIGEAEAVLSNDTVCSALLLVQFVRFSMMSQMIAGQEETDASETMGHGAGPPSKAPQRRQPAHGVPTAKVERLLLENPFEVAFGTTRAIAGHCHTSSATVVRASQRLGYRGFIELRDAVRRSLRK